MSAALLASRLLLACVLGVAGAAKLADLEGAQLTAAAFGVPRRLTAAFALLLPLAELTIALTLIPDASARAAAAAAAALTAAFAAGVAATLVRGRRPECNCFGSLHSAPIGPWTLVRNVALVALAATVAAQQAPHLGLLELGVAAAALLLAAQAWLWHELLRRYGVALRRIVELEGDDGVELPQLIEPGAEAPAFLLADVDGRLVTLRDIVQASAEVVLLFTDPSCGACDLALRSAGARRPGVVAISTGERAEVARKAAEHDLELALLDPDRDVAALYGVRGVPTAFLVGTDGRVASEAAVGSAMVAALLEERAPAAAR